MCIPDITPPAARTTPGHWLLLAAEITGSKYLTPQPALPCSLAHGAMSVHCSQDAGQQPTLSACPDTTRSPGVCLTLLSHSINGSIHSQGSGHELVPSSAELAAGLGTAAVCSHILLCPASPRSPLAGAVAFWLSFFAFVFLLLSLPFFLSCGDRHFHSQAVSKFAALIQSCDSHCCLGSVTGIQTAEERHDEAGT